MIKPYEQTHPNDDDIRRCPHSVTVASHYRKDGTCKCDDPKERKRLDLDDEEE